MKGTKTQTERLEAVPKVYPALMRSQKVGSRAAKAGMDYQSAETAWKDLESELAELQEAVKEKSQEHIEEELGDLLFSVTNVARHLGIDSEYALTRSCDKFIKRFAAAEELAEEQGVNMKDASSAVFRSTVEGSKGKVHSR